MSTGQDIFYHSESSGFELNAEFSVTSEFTSIRPVSETDMHVLYKGLRHGRIWILKGLQPVYIDNDECKQMLVKEFDIMMHLQHGSIVAPHSIETIGDLGLCIVMEYVNGVTLNEWLRESHPLRRRLQMAFELCDAFAFINKCGIVHRDIKPGNIMISRIGGGVKIIDFGHADTDNHSLFKYPAGTEGFISPEQLGSSEPDVRNDIYSFGKVLDFLLPEKRFNNTRSKCIADIKERFSRFEEIKKNLLHDSHKVPVYLIVSVIIICMVVTGLYFFSGDDEKKDSGITTLAIENLDITDVYAASDSSPRSHSIKDNKFEEIRPQATNADKEGNILEKRNNVSNDHGITKELPDIQGVFASINNLWDNTANTYLDTITDVENMYLEWSTFQMEMIKNKFLDSLPQTIAFEDRMEIENQINDLIDSNHKKWHKRRLEIKRKAQLAQ